MNRRFSSGLDSFEIIQANQHQIKNNLEKTDPSEIENLQYKKTADSVVLRLFMRTNGKCNNSHAP